MHLLLLAHGADPTGLARGRWPAPAWAIGLACAVLVAFAATFLVLRARRAKSGPKGARSPGARS